MKRILSGILVCLMLIVILFLTLQSPKETNSLSQTVHHWLSDKGLEVNPHILRSIAHIPLYFLLGIVLALFCKTAGWNRIWIPIIIGCIIGLADETLKIFLSTREFEIQDLLLDWIGIALGALSISTNTKQRLPSRRKEKR